jgi:hypothetical protein
LADVGQYGIIAFDVVRVTPARVVDGLSVTDVVELHVVGLYVLDLNWAIIADDFYRPYNLTSVT